MLSALRLPVQLLIACPADAVGCSDTQTVAGPIGLIALLVVAAGTLIAGIVVAVQRWRSLDRRFPPEDHGRRPRDPGEPRD